MFSTLYTLFIFAFIGFAMTAPTTTPKPDIASDMPELEEICKSVAAINRIEKNYPGRLDYYLICQYGKANVGKCSDGYQFALEYQDCVKIAQ